MDSAKNLLEVPAYIAVPETVIPLAMRNMVGKMLSAQGGPEEQTVVASGRLYLARKVSGLVRYYKEDKCLISVEKRCERAELSNTKSSMARFLRGVKPVVDKNVFLESHIPCQPDEGSLVANTPAAKGPPRTFSELLPGLTKPARKLHVPFTLMSWPAIRFLLIAVYLGALVYSLIFLRLGAMRDERSKDSLGT